MTKPGLLGRRFGKTTSPALTKANRLLGEMNQASIKDNTKKNYLTLTQVKQSIREIISKEDLSSEDKRFLRGLIATINGRINNIIENTPELARILEPQNPPLATDIANARNDDLIKLISYLSKVETFNSALFKEKFQENFPGLEAFNIQYLGGGNSTNYLLTNPITEEQYVLKITPVKGNSQYTADRLKNTSVN